MTDILIVALTVVTFLYLLQSLLVNLGISNLKYQTGESLPAISILVALRDEGPNIDECVKSLLALDYPESLLEIVLINDRSTDGTAALIDRYEALSPKIRAHHIKQGIAGLSGKANAIAQGIPASRGEIILVTDGDCSVPPGWARAHVKYYSGKVGMVAGFTLLDQPDDGATLFKKVQSLDWMFLLSLGTGALGLGRPLSVLGNNFSFRKKAYEQVGGYRAMGFTIIEDFALMKRFVKNTDWQVRYPIDPAMLVLSKPMVSLPAFFQQRKRWSAGGKEVGSYGKFLMLIAFAAHLLIPAAVPFSPIAAISALTAIMLSDFLLLRKTARLVGRQDLVHYFFPWQMFYFLYTTFFAPVLLFPTTVKWKSISYSWRFNFKLKQISGPR